MLHALQNADGPLDLTALQEATDAKALRLVQALERLERAGTVAASLEHDPVVRAHRPLRPRRTAAR